MQAIALGDKTRNNSLAATCFSAEGATEEKLKSELYVLTRKI